MYGMRSTNPIWRLASVFGPLDSWNENTKLVVVGNSAAGGNPVGASNQNFQILGVTNVASNQAMTAIPLPIER
jgi:hypothetical protein